MPAWITTLLGSTEPGRRRLGVAAIVGLIAGTFSAIVKFGWRCPSLPAPPASARTRTPHRPCWSGSA